MSDGLPVVRALWAAPAGVHALTTTRDGGVSRGPYMSLNLGDHVGDDPEVVQRNRARACTALGLPGPPRWLNQVHGTSVATGDLPSQTADASITHRRGDVLAILTADCLPVALSAVDTVALGLAHAGWRSLLGGVLENTVRAMQVDGAIVAWLGPAIGPDAFEVGDDVRSAFVRYDRASSTAFRPGRGDRWWCDLYALAKLRLASVGVTCVHGGGRCTFGEPRTFFSHRRGAPCGRQATFVWRDVQ
ncbi:MAG: peptidoglycan editing factor PgeF [Pseudomonadota bacterium]